MKTYELLIPRLETQLLSDWTVEVSRKATIGPNQEPLPPDQPSYGPFEPCNGQRIVLSEGDRIRTPADGTAVAWLDGTVREQYTKEVEG